MKEIGGYFSLEEFVNNEFYPNLIALNSCRNAFLYLIRALDYQKVYLPFLLCDSMAQVCRNEGVEVEFYSIDKNFLPVFSRPIENNEVLLVVNYYGQLTDQNVNKLKKNYKNIILDNTQAFFQQPIDGVDTIYSCRKFFGVPDGAYLASKCKSKEALLPDMSKDRMIALLGRYEDSASAYYEAFKASEYSIEIAPLKVMSKLTKNLLAAIDYEKVRKKRNANFTFLYNALRDYNQITVQTPDGPFAYPFIVKDGLQVRKKLAKLKIYIPLLWPNVMQSTSPDSLEYHYAANILPLPCDQRYDEGDMEYIIVSLLSFVK
ncbi:MAG TPA: hypothetical protein PKM56_18250 [Candidatus Rifleibacterium sp.]|nr:hypothetical protein [Candidatus Rifleibacterium sp.]